MSALCPKDGKPCIDDLCYGGGCLEMNGYPMLEVCGICKGAIDKEDDLSSTCTCDEDEDWITSEDAEDAAHEGRGSDAG